MDELHNLLDNHPEPFKVEITCWGCGAKESENEKGKRFMDCPHCIKRKLMKSRFCSQECFGKSWVRHKQWHKEQKEKVTKRLVSNRCNPQEIEDLSKQGPYGELLAKAVMHDQNNEYSLARPLYRKAMKLDARRPEAYFCLGQCYENSNLLKEAVQHYEMALERWAFVTVTGRLGDHQLDNFEQDGTKIWVNSVYSLLIHYLSEEFNDWEKPTWYCQDAILKKILKLVKDTVYADVDSNEDKKSQVSLWVAYALSGVVSGGIIHQYLSIPDDRTHEDLIQAAACFRAGCSDGDENNSTYLSHAETMLDIAARFRSDNNIEFGFDDVASSQFLSGSWVVMHGLTSTTGVLLNKKLAFVYGKDKTTGRLIVQIDENKVQKKLFLPRNLFELPMKDNMLEISSTMEKSAQWTYFQFNVETLADKVMAAARLKDVHANKQDWVDLMLCKH